MDDLKKNEMNDFKDEEVTIQDEGAVATTLLQAVLTDRAAPPSHLQVLLQTHNPSPLQLLSRV